MSDEQNPWKHKTPKEILKDIDDFLEANWDQYRLQPYREIVPAMAYGIVLRSEADTRIIGYQRMSGAMLDRPGTWEMLRDKATLFSDRHEAERLCQRIRDANPMIALKCINVELLPI